MRRLSTAKRWIFAAIVTAAVVVMVVIGTQTSGRDIPNFSGEIVVYFGSSMKDSSGSNKVEQSSQQYQLKVALTDKERQQGLMFVPPERLLGGRGMIFVFPEENINRFWMKNTPAELDMIFVNSSGSVVGVLENVAPYSTESRFVARPSRYVIELSGGTARRDNIKVGDKLMCEAPRFGIPC